MLSNILQVKERGALTIVLTNLADISEHINLEKCDFLIELAPSKSVLAALQCLIPLELICYYAALARDINPDQKIFDAIDYGLTE